MEKRTCEICGKEFTPKGWKQKKCEEHTNFMKIRCATCGKEFIAPKGNRKYCDECRVGERPCNYCGKMYTPKSTANKAMYCSAECSHKARYSEGRYFKPMQHGYSKKGRNSADNGLMAEARRVCYTHYERKCAICNFNSDPNKVQVHHIDEDRQHNNIENLIPVCDSCHRIIHVLIRRLKEHPENATLNKLAEVVNLNLLKTGNPKP